MGLAFVSRLPFSTDGAGDFPFETPGAVIFGRNILVIGMIAFVQRVHIRDRQAGLAPEPGSAWIRREIRRAIVLPVLAAAGIVLSATGLPWSTAVFLIAPRIMAWLYWKAPVKGIAV